MASIDISKENVGVLWQILKDNNDCMRKYIPLDKDTRRQLRKYVLRQKVDERQFLNQLPEKFTWDTVIFLLEEEHREFIRIVWTFCMKKSKAVSQRLEAEYSKRHFKPGVPEHYKTPRHVRRAKSSAKEQREIDIMKSLVKESDRKMIRLKQKLQEAKNRLKELKGKKAFSGESRSRERAGKFGREKYRDAEEIKMLKDDVCELESRIKYLEKEYSLDVEGLHKDMLRVRSRLRSCESCGSLLHQ